MQTTATAANGGVTVGRRRGGQSEVVRIDRLAIPLSGDRHLASRRAAVDRGEPSLQRVGSIRRQQWDLFNRTPAGMQAWRVQAKTLADFQAKHPGFVRHWSPASFGENWLPDYSAAPPERRPDLDLPTMRCRRAWERRCCWRSTWCDGLATRNAHVPVFLPGFKHNSRADIRVDPVGTEPGGLLHLRSSVRHPQLSEVKASTGDAWISADHHLVRETFDARTDTCQRPWGAAPGRVSGRAAGAVVHCLIRSHRFITIKHHYVMAGPEPAISISTCRDR